jgi:rRNA maturation endonuclease Nob1
VTAPYSYDGMLPLGPERGSEYVCSRCESTFDDDRYLCPVCGTLTLERRSTTES